MLDLHYFVRRTVFRYLPKTVAMLENANSIRKAICYCGISLKLLIAALDKSILETIASCVWKAVYIRKVFALDRCLLERYTALCTFWQREN